MVGWPARRQAVSGGEYENGFAVDENFFDYVGDLDRAPDHGMADTGDNGLRSCKGRH